MLTIAANLSTFLTRHLQGPQVWAEFSQVTPFLCSFCQVPTLAEPTSCFWLVKLIFTALLAKDRQPCRQPWPVVTAQSNCNFVSYVQIPCSREHMPPGWALEVCGHFYCYSVFEGKRLPKGWHWRRLKCPLIIFSFPKGILDRIEWCSSAWFSDSHLVKLSALSTTILPVVTSIIVSTVSCPRTSMSLQLVTQFPHKCHRTGPQKGLSTDSLSGDVSAQNFILCMLLSTCSSQCHGLCLPSA